MSRILATKVSSRGGGPLMGYYGGHAPASSAMLLMRASRMVDPQASGVRHMSFWGDFREKLSQEYNKNKDLKDNVEKLKETAQHVGETSSKITHKAKDTLHTVQDKIKLAVPIAPDSTKIKQGAGKASEGLKKALDFLGNNLTFLKTESSVPPPRPQATKSDTTTSTTSTTSTTAKSTATTTNTTTTATTQPPTASAQPNAEKTPKQTPESDRPKAGPPPIVKTQSAQPPEQQTVPPLENPEEAPGGGTALTIRPTTEWERYWQKLGGEAASEIGQRVGARVGTFMSKILPETSIAQTVSKIKETNPDFTMHTFLSELQEFVPLVMECLLLADVKGMKPLASEKMYRMFMDIVRNSTTRGTFQDSKLLDIGQIELWDAKLDDNNRPSFIITFSTQFIYTIRDRAGKVIEGAEDDIKSSHYIMMITPDPSETSWVCHEIMQQSLTSYL